MKCETCGSEKECRPYGANGAMICFQCAFATPEAKARTECNYSMQLEAAGPQALVGLECGPVRATEKMLDAILKDSRHD